MALLPRLLAFIPVALLPAFAVLLVDQDDGALRFRVAAALAAGTVLALAAAWALGRRFVQEPLRNMIAVVHALRDGGYNLRGDRTAGIAEFAQLSGALDEMAQRLAAREAALRESEQRFRRLSDASFEGIAIHDGARVTEANAAAARIFGYRPGEVVGMPLDAFLAPAARAYSLAQAHAHEETRYESVGLRRDGTTFPVEFRGRRIEQEGRPRRIIAIRDLTEQKNAAAALQESEERLKLALAAGGLGTWDLDVATQQLRLDDRQAAMLNVPPERMQGPSESYQSLVHPEDRPRALAEFDAHLKGHGPASIEYRVIRGDGTERWHVSRAIVLRSADGTPVRAVGVTQDITEQKQAESRLKLLAAEVDHRSKNMLSMVQIMLRHTHADTVREYAAAAQGRVAALGRAHTLLSQSRWQAADLLRLAEEELAPFRREDGARVRLRGPPVALSPTAAQSLAMALHELATNAAKYGALSVPHGSVTVDWSTQADGRLALRWSETGGPPVQPPTYRGFGTKVIEQSICGQLKGEAHVSWHPAGLVCRLIVPADQLVQSKS
jgi:PAS domain S-box-containing protein